LIVTYNIRHYRALHLRVRPHGGIVTLPDSPLAWQEIRAAMLLDWIARRRPGHESYAEAARLVENAIDTLVTDPARRTRDLGGKLGTKALTGELCREIEAALAQSTGRRTA